MDDQDVSHLSYLFARIEDSGILTYRRDRVQFSGDKHNIDEVADNIY
jgi:hypothetical protein